MTELTEWERRRLDDLARRLAREDPRLAARLTTPVHARRTRVPAAVGWAMFLLGLPLLLCGVALGIAWLAVVAVLMLSTCWVPMVAFGIGRTGLS